MPLGTNVGLRPQCDRWDPAHPMERGTAALTIQPMSIMAKRSPISATAEFFALHADDLV